MSPPRSITLPMLAVCLLAGACVGEPDQLADQLDEDALARADGYRDFAKINSTPYLSSIGNFDINLYVGGDAASYAKVHPDRTGSGAHVAVGTVIVREVLDANGKVAKLTIMAKGPPGYDPTLGDWWFGVTDPNGTPLVKDGELQVGRLTQCHECHSERADDDFIFGVPQADSDW